LRRGTELIENLDRFKLLKLAYSFFFSPKEDEQVSEELLLVKELNETLINDLPVGILVLDMQKRVYLSNQIGRSIMDMEDSNISGREIESLFPAGKVKELEDILQSIEKKKRDVWERIVFPDNRILKIKVFPLRNENSLYLGTVMLLEDVSMDYFVKEYLEQAEKITSIAELAAGVAHEINNPLGIIRNYVALLRTKQKDDESRGKIEKIEKELKRIVEITHSLLSFSKNQKQIIRKFDIVGLLNEVLVLLSHKINDKFLDVQINSHPTYIEYRGDENKLKQLFLNIISNSIEAVLDHGIIRIEIRENQNENLVTVKISDNGYGIPEEIYDEIYTPFFSTKMDKQNTGLGLSISQNIVETHRGTISFESEAGKGTTFSITLPLLI
jgi:two-component system sensor histidine kinase AtoS